MILLTETNTARIQHEGRKTFIEGIALQADMLNKNRRVYPKAVLESAVDAVQGKIKEGKLLGQLGHPSDADGNLDRVSHVIESLTRKGNDYHLRARIIDEGAGKIAKSIIDAGGRLGVSSRGHGSTRQDKAGSSIVCEDYRLITIDLVQDPSCEAAFVSAIKESIKNHDFTVNENAIALRILNDLDPSLADLQRRTGYDFDGKAGNQFPGHASFTSVGDKRTYLERLEADRVEILKKLAGVQAEIDLQDDQISEPELKKYADMATDPVKKAIYRRALQQHENHKHTMRRAIEFTRRMHKRGYWK
jgi:hypothetical protein